MATTDVRLPEGWRLLAEGKQMGIEVTTRDFLQAMDVVNEIARVAEEMEHHPDLHIESWNHLRIITYSHDEGRLTSRDERLASRVDEILRRRGLAPS